MWHRDDEAFDERLAATPAPAPSAGERRNRELRQQMGEQDRWGSHEPDRVYIGQERTGARRLISTTRQKANAVPHLGLERLRARDRGWFGTLFASCEDEHEDGSYCGFARTTRAIHAFFFDEPPADNVDAFGFKIEEWDKAEMERARATRRRWQCLRVVFVFLVITAVVAGSVFVDEVAAKEKTLSAEQQAEFEAQIQAKIDRLTLPTPPPTPPPPTPPVAPWPPVVIEPPNSPPPIYQFGSIEDAREALRAGGVKKLDFNKLVGEEACVRVSGRKTSRRHVPRKKNIYIYYRHCSTRESTHHSD